VLVKVYTESMAFIQKLPLRVVRLASISAGTILFMLSTTPAKLPALLLIVPFVGIFSILYLVTAEIIRFLGPDDEEGSAVVRFRRPRLMAAVVAGFPVLLLVLQSIVELTIWDVLIAFAIVMVAYLYLSRSAVSLWKR
jgi:hypothetical protein